MCTTAFEDNYGAKHLAQNSVCTSNSNHIDVRHYFLRELTFKGDLVITHVETEEATCRFADKAIHQCGFTLPPELSDEYLMSCFRCMGGLISALEWGKFFSQF